MPHQAPQLPTLQLPTPAASSSNRHSPRTGLTLPMLSVAFLPQYRYCPLYRPSAAMNSCLSVAYRTVLRKCTWVGGEECRGASAAGAGASAERPPQAPLLPLLLLLLLLSVQELPPC